MWPGWERTTVMRPAEPWPLPESRPRQGRPKGPGPGSTPVVGPEPQTQRDLSSRGRHSLLTREGQGSFPVDQTVLYPGGVGGVSLLMPHTSAIYLFPWLPMTLITLEELRGPGGPSASLASGDKGCGSRQVEDEPTPGRKGRGPNIRGGPSWGMCHTAPPWMEVRLPVLRLHPALAPEGSPGQGGQAGQGTTTKDPSPGKWLGLVKTLLAGPGTRRQLTLLWLAGTKDSLSSAFPSGKRGLRLQWGRVGREQPGWPPRRRPWEAGGQDQRREGWQGACPSNCCSPPSPEAPRSAAARSHQACTSRVSSKTPQQILSPRGWRLRAEVGAGVSCLRGNPGGRLGLKGLQAREHIPCQRPQEVLAAH